MCYSAALLNDSHDLQCEHFIPYASKNCKFSVLVSSPDHCFHRLKRQETKETRERSLAADHVCCASNLIAGLHETWLRGLFYAVKEASLCNTTVVQLHCFCSSNKSKRVTVTSHTDRASAIPGIVFSQLIFHLNDTNNLRFSFIVLNQEVQYLDQVVRAKQGGPNLKGYSCYFNDLDT